MHFFKCLMCCGHLYVHPDSLKWASAVNITDTDIKTGLLHPKSGGVRSSCHLHFGHLQQDHRLLASHTAGQTPALTSLIYSVGARAWRLSTILRVSKNFLFSNYCSLWLATDALTFSNGWNAFQWHDLLLFLSPPASVDWWAVSPSGFGFLDHARSSAQAKRAHGWGQTGPIGHSENAL